VLSVDDIQQTYGEAPSVLPLELQELNGGFLGAERCDEMA
jgi:hypothetical protein